MAECDLITRKWGNSVGVILPKELNLKPNQKIHVLIVKNDHTAKKTFGMFKDKIKKSGQELKDEIRRELHGIK